jgi:hypothetical protein
MYERNEAVTVTLPLEERDGSPLHPRSPPPSSDGFVVTDEEEEAEDSNAGQPTDGSPAHHPWPERSPFISTDPNVPTVWGNKDKDGVDPDDPYCMWRNGHKFCI